MFSSVFMLLALPQFSIVFLLLLCIATTASLLISLVLNSATALQGALKRKSVAFLGIFIVLCLLSVFKYRFIQGLLIQSQIMTEPSTSRFIFFIGISYFSFKMIHVIVESYRRKLDFLTPLTYFNYIFLFPSFISGPINRFNHFSSQWATINQQSRSADWRVGGERIVHGLFKKFVLVQLLYPHILSNRPDDLAQLPLLQIVTGLYAYAFYFYFDFSSYTDLAIGSARILGIGLPENFNRPFLKRNIRELWTSWHMTLTSWLVDYVYWPIVRRMRNVNYFREHPVVLSNIGMIITFIICGMWHGESLNFILWGGYHGIGIAGLTIYQRRKKKCVSPLLQRYFRSRLSQILGVVATFNYFALGLALFVLDTRGLAAAIARITGT